MISPIFMIDEMGNHIFCWELDVPTDISSIVILAIVAYVSANKSQFTIFYNP
nr:hypothetical protein [Tanacetum cinerariifolium]